MYTNESLVAEPFSLLNICSFAGILSTYLFQSSDCKRISLILDRGLWRCSVIATLELNKPFCSNPRNRQPGWTSSGSVQINSC